MRRWLALIVMVLLAGCGTGDAVALLPPRTNVGATPDGRVTVSFGAWQRDRPQYEALAQRFSQEHPDIRIEIVPLDSLLGNADPQTSAGPLGVLRLVVSGVDAAPASLVTPEAFGTDLLHDLTPLMAADPTFQGDDFYPGALEQYRSEGGLWVLPRSFSVAVLSYNKELFEQAGLPEPQPGWSWSELLGSARGVATATTSTRYGYLDPSNGFLPLVGVLREQGIELLDAPTGGVALDGPEVVGATGTVRDLAGEGALLPLFGTDSVDDGQLKARSLVDAGRVAIWDETMLAPGLAAEARSYRFAVGRVPYPAGGLDVFGDLPGEGYVISGGSRNAEAAWHWIEFLSRQPIPPAAGGRATQRLAPARHALAEQTGFWSQIDEETATAYRWTIAHPTPLKQQALDLRVLNLLQPALRRIIAQPARNPLPVLTTAQRLLEQQFTISGRTPVTQREVEAQ
ncbi:MAG TPA: extracellular solute-binding protein [Roseiflexaceae bacterium]|nr:extracellular solute-binding protein [Roseiflexaceae bacterium]